MGATEPKDVRLKDVAARAGVSTATVARVLHENGYVSAQARERVFAALQESGYRINAVAQGLRRRRTMTLGHIVPGILPNPFVAEVAMGVEHAAAEKGYNVLIFNSRVDAGRERAGVEALLARRVDGIIFTTAVQAENVALVLQAGVPAVEIEKPLCDEAASVMVDNYHGVSAAIEHLISLGHRRIGYIGEPVHPLPGAPDNRVDRVVQERLQAYRDVLESAEIPADESLVVLGDFAHDPGWRDVRTGKDYMETLLAQEPELTAVFASSDVLAAGVLQALYSRGARVPDHMSVVGFDDTYAKHLSPPLTTVHQPMFEMGATAAQLAIASLVQEWPEPPREWLTTSLVIRNSTGPPHPTPRARTVAGC
jgi:LacI family transcriptional regulator